MTQVLMFGLLVVLSFWALLHLAFRRTNAVAAIVAHRGAAGQAPENTLVGLRKGIQAGASFIEFDIRRTADGHFVLMHDATVDRTTNDRGEVRQLTLAQLRELDAGAWFGVEFAGEPVPTFSQALALLADWPGAIVVEVKDPTANDTVAFLSAVAGLPSNKVQLVSFDHEWLAEIRRQAPDLGLGQLSVYPGQLPDRAQADRIGVYWLSVVLDPTLVARAKRAGLEIWVWTADHPLLQRWLAWKGVDGITTNFPVRSQRLPTGGRSQTR